MKYGIARTSLAAALAVAVWPASASRAASQTEQDNNLPRYSISTLSTLGGTQSQADGINNRGWISGDANLPGDQTEHPTVWRDGVITDLGTLGGPNGASGFSFKNDRGLIAAFAQTETPDPLGENWNIYCTFQESGGPPCNGTDLILGAFLWTDGVKIPLATLGGNNANAAAVNNRGQVVGWAETSTVDATCVAPQVLDIEAVIWNPRNHQIHELQPFPGDVASGALAINDFGQVVGASGNCAPVSPAIGAHAVLWQNGSVISLGSLGGAFTNVAYDINNRSQVVGVSDLPGDTTAHAFFWENGKMTDLGTLPGDFFSVAFAINVKGQVVGQSCDQNGNCRAFIWQNGVMTDLNALVSDSSSLYLYVANDINDLGEIVGQAVDPVTGNAPAFLATPTSAGEYGEAAAEQVGENAGTKVKVVLPEKVLKSLQQRKGFRRFGSQLIDLRGTGLVSGPYATLSPTSLKFATHLIGTTSSAHSVTLANHRTVALAITSIGFTGGAPGDFAQTNTCGSSVAPGSSCTIRVTFTPAEAGVATGALAVENNAAGSPQNVSLSGTGTVVELVPSNLAFHIFVLRRL